MLWILAYVVVGQVVYHAIRFINRDQPCAVHEALVLRLICTTAWPLAIVMTVGERVSDVRVPWWL